VSVLTITTAATDRKLTTLGRAREDVAALKGASDPWLTKAIERASDEVCQIISVARGGITPPTLAQETLTEVFRSDRATWVSGTWPFEWSSDHPPARTKLRLARRPVASITSIDIDGTALTAAEYALDGAAGIIERLTTDGVPTAWNGLVVTIVYVAGYGIPGSNVLPALLPRYEEACILLVKDRWLNKDRDQRLRSEEVNGVRNTSYWVGPIDGNDPSGLPAEVARLLYPDREIGV
jgi:hypothetical protein